ncbi:phage baseplate assembly protein V [Lyngbya confervoides]|uniref:Phage baseplate assembly protein V n=1 Tax=Lyngbya confervoides BDU141951 TaxID=1574623 RepID=A0ABD4T452_9CYAN|nr:phage baseplate assembly protein V [Lyngbya confervoides]MCM1983269.1 phage baseplate assembly protein V [Lyngbya confervoides BDU141951]
MDSDYMRDMAEGQEGRFFGKYRGVVKDNQDPTLRGRLEVLVPTVMDEEPIWAMPCVPYAGDNMGTYTIPEPGTGVWIEFEAGDPSYPIWVGCFWGDGEAPKTYQNTPATPPLKIIRSQKGLIVTLDDQQQVIAVSDKNGTNLITIEVLPGKVTVQGGTKVVVEAPLIELVENATHPVVFGDQLLSYLNQLVSLYQSHTHPGELALGVLPVTPAPPVPPLPPPTPVLLSTRVKTG